MAHRRITLSRLEYDTLWEHLRLGAFPTVLEINSAGRTLAERARLVGAAWAGLGARGLGGPGAVDADLERLLRRLATPEWELDARIELPGRPGPRVSVLIAATGKVATVAVLDAATLRLWPVPADRIAQHAVTLLPEHRPGTGVSITIPARTLDQAIAGAGSDRGALLTALVAAGLGRSEARRFTEVTGSVIRFGHFGAARTVTSSRRRAGHVVSVYDSATEGRYLCTRKQQWITLASGTPAAITRQLAELFAELESD